MSAGAHPWLLPIVEAGLRPECKPLASFEHSTNPSPRQGRRTNAHPQREDSRLRENLLNSSSCYVLEIIKPGIRPVPAPTSDPDAGAGVSAEFRPSL